MTQKENTPLFKKSWHAIVLIIVTQFTMSFLGTFSSQKLYEYRLKQVEQFKQDFDAYYEDNIGILFFMHGLSKRNGNKEVVKHTHKK